MGNLGLDFITEKYDVQSINSLYNDSPSMGTLANNVDPDEMQLYAAFHQGLHCLLLLHFIRVYTVCCDQNAL